MMSQLSPDLFEESVHIFIIVIARLAVFFIHHQEYA